MGAACSSEDNTKTKDPPKTATSSQPNVIAQRFERIRDKFETVDEVQQALRQAGLESSDLILAIDLTKSNEWSGKHSFNGVSPHALQHAPDHCQLAFQLSYVLNLADSPLCCRLHLCNCGELHAIPFSSHAAVQEQGLRQHSALSI